MYEDSGPLLITVEHLTASDALRAYWRQRPDEANNFLEGDIECVTLEGERRTLPASQVLALVESEGMWAFVEAGADPVAVHLWRKDDADAEDLACMLGHELGGVIGLPLDDDLEEEARANAYGDVASWVVATLLDLGDVVSRARHREAVALLRLLRQAHPQVSGEDAARIEKFFTEEDA